MKSFYTILKGIWALMLIIHINLSYAKVNMHIDHREMNLNETLTLTITSDNPKNQSAPNINALEKDFSILSSEHRMNYQFNNGVSSTNNEWVYILFPKHTGVINIPAINLGQEKANTDLSITVNASGTQQPNSKNLSYKDEQETADVFIKSNINTHSSYVNAELIYSVKIFTRRHLLDIDYTPPSIPNALVIPLDVGQHYQTLVGNDIYSVQTLKYAIFPNLSGPITIEPPSLSALMVDFIPERIQVKGQIVKLSIMPAPKDLKSFLPARKIELSEEFEPKDNTFKEGQTITRIVTIKGIGVPSTLLPNLKFKQKNLEVYPAPPILTDSQSDQGITGKSVIKLTYLLENKGKYTIPAINIPWFNTKTHQAENASLPEHTLTVLADAVQQNAGKDPIFSPKSIASKNPNDAISLWMLSTIFLSLTVLYLVLKPWIKLSPLTQKFKLTNKELSFNKTKRNLNKACRQQNPHAAAQHLLSWASLHWPKENIINLQQISEHCKNSQLAEEIAKLTQYLYGQNNNYKWSGLALWQAFSKFLQEKPAKSQEKNPNELPPLNPN